MIRTKKKGPDGCCCCCKEQKPLPQVLWKKNICCWDAKKITQNPKEFSLLKITEIPARHTGRDLKFEQLKTYVGKQDKYPSAICSKLTKTWPASALRRTAAEIKESIKYHKKRQVESPINMFRLVGNDYGNGWYRKLYAKLDKERKDKRSQLLRNKDRENKNKGAFRQVGKTCGNDRINKNIWNPIGPRIYPTIENIPKKQIQKNILKKTKNLHTC